MSKIQFCYNGKVSVQGHLNGRFAHLFPNKPAPREASSYILTAFGILTEMLVQMITELDFTILTGWEAHSTFITLR